MRLDPPLDPTSPEARDWLEDELSKGIYRDDRGPLEPVPSLGGGGVERGIESHRLSGP